LINSSLTMDSQPMSLKWEFKNQGNSFYTSRALRHTGGPDSRGSAQRLPPFNTPQGFAMYDVHLAPGRRRLPPLPSTPPIPDSMSAIFLVLFVSMSVLS